MYVATYGAQLAELRDHSYYELQRSAVTELIETIKTFEPYAEQIETSQGLITHYYRARPADVQNIVARLSELASVDWTQPPLYEPCQGVRPESKISLRRDLDEH